MKYTVTSFSEGRKGGQITVTVGEGSERRSFTRHLHYQGRALMGLNIDERAPKLNAIYEAELRTAENELTSAETEFKKLLKKREDILNVESKGHVVTDEAKAELEATLDVAEAKVVAVTAIVDDADTKLTIIRRELPLMMEFYHN